MKTQSVARPIQINKEHVEMLLAAYRVSKRRVAVKAGVHPATVSKALRNRRDLSTEKKMAVLLAIATLTDRDPDALVRGRLAA
jgi:hypothetical protein